jgi:hypothetical protein
MIEVAVRQGYPITPEMRTLVVTQAALVCGTSLNERNRLAACKVIITADRVNAMRETNALAERRTEISAATQAMREALKNPAAREKLAQLSEQLTAPKVVDAEVQTQVPAAPKANGSAGNGAPPAA